MVGISIGIATIVALGLFTNNMAELADDVLKQGSFDFTVAKAGSADVILSYVKSEQVEEVRNTPGVDIASGVLMVMLPVDNNPYFFVIGMEPEYSDYSDIKIIEGDMFAKESEDQVILGKIAAKNLEKEVNDTFTANQKDYKIVGIFESGISFQDGGAMIDVKTAQKLQDLEDTVNMLSVKVEEGYDIKQVADRVEEQSDGELVSIIELDDLESVDQGMKIMEGTSWAIGLLAIVIGGIGVMNTMIMSVSERTREIGVLRALGWKRRRILAMILGESLFLCVVAIIIGVAAGVVAVRLLMFVDVVESWIHIDFFMWETYIQAVIVAVFVALIGGFYPAWRASKLSPLEALRYE